MFRWVHASSFRDLLSVFPGMVPSLQPSTGSDFLGDRMVYAPQSSVGESEKCRFFCPTKVNFRSSSSTLLWQLLGDFRRSLQCIFRITIVCSRGFSQRASRGSSNVFQGSPKYVLRDLIVFRGSSRDKTKHSHCASNLCHPGRDIH